MTFSPENDRDPGKGDEESIETHLKPIGRQLWPLERSPSFDLEVDLEGHDLSPENDSHPGKGNEESIETCLKPIGQ